MSTRRVEAVAESVYDREAHAIQARQLAFRWDDVPLHYVPNRPVATHLYNCMHLLLPEGEKAMAKALTQALPLIDDPRLREEILGFIGQETTHAAQHGGMRERLVELGLDPAPVINRLNELLDVIMRDAGPDRVRHQLLCERLALFAALEHYTAVWGRFFLESDGLARSGIHPMVLDLLRWHGAEEVEHRSVVFDAYMHIDGSYARRVRMALLGSSSLLAVGLLSLAWLLAHDPELDRPRNPVTRLVRPVKELVEATRARVVPNFMWFATEVPHYLRPGFHPSQLEGMELAVRYIAKAPIVDGGVS